MTNLFVKIVNMSISASWLVLAVLILCFILKRAPKWIHVLLWGAVAVRLICPLSIKSALSLIPSAETINPTIMMDKVPSIQTGVPAINSVINPVIISSLTPAVGDSVNPLQIWIPILTFIWLVGIAVLLVYTAASYWRLRHRISEAVILRENIYQSENIGSPFVLGMIIPKIYLPYTIGGQNLNHVVAHEQAHIRRRDHWWKPLGFLLLTIHWFNPLMWLAYVLLCRDIELACDEKVIKELGREQRADYTQALLACSVNRRMITACPLAFGEVSVKERVKSVMNYKRPAFWLIILSVVACVAVAVCFLTDPVTSPAPNIEFTTSESGPLVTEWFDYLTSPDEMKWDGGLEINIPAFPNVTFRWSPEKIDAITEEEIIPLFYGMPIWNAYFCDLTGDGLPEICATITYGSGMIDSRIKIYDYENGTSYELEDRGVYDYSLRMSRDDGQLYVDKKAYNRSALISTGRLAFKEDTLQIIISNSGQNTAFLLSPGTTYVSWQCLYRNPLSSYGHIDDSGCRYEIRKDSFAIINLLGENSAPTGTDVDYTESRLKAMIPVSKWEWQEFPYTEEEWEAHFGPSMSEESNALFSPEMSTPISDIHALYSEILYQPLNDQNFLLLADGDLLLVTLSENAQGGKYIWSIYSLINETNMGVAQWEYAPILSSRLPAFRFEFDMDHKEISATCINGRLVDFDSQSASQSAPSDAGLIFPKGNALYWSPMDETGSIASDTAIHFICTREDGSQYTGTLYITAGGSSNGRTVYTATLVGAGLHLSPNTKTEGGVVSLLTADTEDYSLALEYDLRNGNLELSSGQLPQYVFFTNSQKIAVTIKSDEDFEGTVILQDISQNNAEIASKDVNRKDGKVVFTGLTSSRLYRVICKGAENCTLTVGQK